MDGNRRKVTLSEELVKLSGTNSATDENNDLVELEFIQKLVELAILLLFFQLDVELLKTVESELSVLIDVVLGRVLHELSANRFHLLGQGGREHHNLLLGRCSAENILHIRAHI